MTTSKGATRCKYCRLETTGSTVVHNVACPNNIRTPEAVTDWKRGYNHGFNYDWEEYGEIKYWLRQYYSPTYLLAYDTGKEEIDRLVRIAFNRSYGLEYNEEDE